MKLLPLLPAHYLRFGHQKPEEAFALADGTLPSYSTSPFLQLPAPGLIVLETGLALRQRAVGIKAPEFENILAAHRIFGRGSLYGRRIRLPNGVASKLLGGNRAVGTI